MLCSRLYSIHTQRSAGSHWRPSGSWVLPRRRPARCQPLRQRVEILSSRSQVTKHVDPILIIGTTCQWQMYCTFNCKGSQSETKMLDRSKQQWRLRYPLWSATTLAGDEATTAAWALRKKRAQVKDSLAWEMQSSSGYRGVMATINLQLCC